MELPPKLEVVWFHLIDSIDTACKAFPTTVWNGCSDSVERNIGKTAEEFYQEAPCKAGDFDEKWGGDLYIGYIFGRYNNLDLDIRLHPSFNIGPNHESAKSDEFVVFFKNMTLPNIGDKRKACSWLYKLPQGFSCGKGAPPDRTCSNSRRDTFRAVPCSEIEVKVLDSEAGQCPRRKNNYKSIYRPSQPNCWAEVKWNFNLLV